MKKFIYLLGFVICFSALLLMQHHPVWADDQTVNEDEVFGGGDTVVSQDQVVKDNVDSELKENHIGFSGQISANMSYNNYNKSYDATGYIKDSEVLSNYMTTDLFLDVRLKQGVKGFLSLEGNYYPSFSEADLINYGVNSTSTDQTSTENQPTNSEYYTGGVKEFFIDANLQNKVYFRIGKQVLKWGQGYFWNPTDLLDIDKKDFQNMGSLREGTYGIKTQIPFGVKQNIYLFTDMDSANAQNENKNPGDPSAVEQALKYEFLLGKTEMSVSTLLRDGHKPVYGWDFTSRLSDVDIRGEMSLTDGSECSRLNYDTFQPETLEEGRLIPRVCLGFTKFFTQGNITDRINLTGEFYYNQAGYDKNIIKRLMESGIITNQADQTNFTEAFPYTPYQDSEYYMALFTSVSKFPGPDTSLNFNAITNLVDHSALLIAGISYAPAINNITVSFNVGYNLGDQYTETMLTGQRYYVNLMTTIRF
jgi:hypothetical protein